MPPQDANPTPSFGGFGLRRREVEQLVGFSRSAIYAKMNNGTFPRPKSIGDGSVRWLHSEVVEWIQQLKSA